MFLYFKIKDDIEYTVPIVETKFHKSDLDVKYIDYEGNFYDKNFNIVSRESDMLIWAKTIESLTKDKPLQRNYDNYFDYEQALVEWKVKLEIAIGDKNLPIPIGRYYYRPGFISLVKSN